MGNSETYRSNRVVDEINYPTTRMKYSSRGSKTVSISKNTDNITVIGSSSIPNALKKTLKSVTMGKATTSIPPSAFIGCESLQSATVPKNCIVIEECAFKDCVNLKYTNILSGGEYAALLIGNHAFDGCNSLESININLRALDYTSYHIGAYAFANCKNLKNVSW